MAGLVLGYTRVRSYGVHHGDGHWWWWLIAVILLGLLMVAIASLFTRQPTGANSSSPSVRPPSPAEQLLAARLARGEIDPDEYRRRRDALRE